MASSLTVWSSTADGRITATSTDYETARSTATSAEAGSGTASFGAQYYSSPNFNCYESFFSFDTSSISSGATITTATFSLYGTGDSSTQDYTLEARIHDWGTSLTTGDWVAGDSLSDKTLVASLSTASWVTSAYNALTSDAAFLSNVSKEGTTYILVNSSRHRLGNQPSATREDVAGTYADDATGAGGTDHDPKLYVELTMLGFCLISNIEMCDLGFSNPVSAETVFLRTQVYLDPSDYDGATYYFEVVGYNNSGSTQNVTLVYWDGDSWESVATVTLSATTTWTRYRSSSFTPITGNKKYALRLPSLGSADVLRINCARMVIKQVDATKTRLQIPLLSSNWANSQFNLNDNSYYIVRNSSATWTTAVTYATQYVKRTAELATISGWSLEGVAALSSVEADTGYFALYNKTDSQRITSTEISVTGTTPTLYNVDFADNATYFDTDDSFYLTYRGDGTYYINLQKAALYVTLTDMTKAHSYMRMMWQAADGNTAIQYTRQQCLLETHNFSGDTVTYYHEEIGKNQDDTNAVLLYDGTAAGDVSGSGVNFYNANTLAKRSSSFTPPASGHTIGWSRQATTNNTSCASGYIVVVVEHSGEVATNRSSLLQFGIA